FFRVNRLLSLNGVGGEPGGYGAGVRAFHADSEYRVRRWPHEMLATSTHDTKRSEDVRARLNVLSEMSTPWREALRRWSRFNRSRRRRRAPRAASCRRESGRSGTRRSARARGAPRDRKSTRLNSSHSQISYAVFCLKKKKKM